MSLILRQREYVVVDEDIAMFSSFLGLFDCCDRGYFLIVQYGNSQSRMLLCEIAGHGMIWGDSG